MKLVIVGNGMVGQRLLERLVSNDAISSAQITVIGEEPRAAYDRVRLTSFFSGQSADDLSLVARDFFDRHGIALHLTDRAVSIDRARKQIHTSSGAVHDYDRAVLATGSYPFVPPIPGRDRKGCFVYRTIEDLEAIQLASLQAKTGVVIGGGLLGLEAAKALKDLGLDTHVVEFAPRLMAVQIDEPAGRVLRSRIAELGVGIHTGKNTAEISDGVTRSQKIRFADSSELETDLVVFSAGIRPRDDLARASGLAVGERGGVVVDSACRTSDPSIYAIGECALWNGKLYGLVAPGYQMANVVAAQLTSQSDASFEGADMSTKLKLMGVDVASLGDAHATTPGARICSFVDERRQIYKKLVISADGQRLLGGILVGDAEDYGNLLQMMHSEAALPERPEQLILPALEGAVTPAAPGPAALPDSAQVCSCNGVTKGQICAAVDAGSKTLADLKKTTRAASSCGGCAQLATLVLKAQLARNGTEVNNHLCDHFPYSRQQMFHLVRAGEIKTFAELLRRHGRGRGCDICKPAAASILASCWNEFVLQQSHAPLQDTNDYYLANIQKDGTYSVIPRIPGGEITPEKLIVIGEVAKKYNLYTKITGGQRIDLLGAQLHQLPSIWEQLIAAGFESGHAYGKAMRTVKSCVGSTWCRYGVQDSVGLAIALENRYKGLRAPHKIKLAVSGCTRECAEAQSKDVGVIATQSGWTLYVCGNGGMKPRHANVLASDIDQATLIRYVDRFLMFYIRTAERLQRTASWLDNLEGGIDYLKQVVCEDKLGLAQQLEDDMARVVNSYACEWKTAVEDPRTRQRFRHFVNSDRGDENVLFVEERGQIRPATHSERLSQTRVAVEEPA